MKDYYPYNGIIKEMIKKDWNFLPKYSQTCRLGSENDNRTLQKNKAIISCKIFKSLGFTTQEINFMYESFEIREGKKTLDTFMGYLRREKSTDRERLYADIWKSIHRIDLINDILNCQLNDKLSKHFASLSINIGLFERNSTTVYHNSDLVRFRFVDKYDIAKHFPAYMRNKITWDYFKTQWLTRKEFVGIITGRYEFSLIRNQSLLIDY